MLNDAQIKDYFSNQVGTSITDCNYFYGQVMASTGKKLLLGNLAGLASKHYIVSINAREMVMITMNSMGKLTDNVVISADNIQEIKLSKWLFGMGYKMNVSLSDGSMIKLKVNKTCVGIKEQKANIAKAVAIIQEKY